MITGWGGEDSARTDRFTLAFPNLVPSRCRVPHLGWELTRVPHLGWEFFAVFQWPLEGLLLRVLTLNSQECGGVGKVGLKFLSTPGMEAI